MWDEDEYEICEEGVGEWYLQAVTGGAIALLVAVLCKHVNFEALLAWILVS